MQIKKNSGFLIVEVLISMFILIIIVVAIYTSASFFIVKSQKSQYNFEAKMLIQESIEIAYSVLQENGNLPDGIYWPVVEDLGYRGQVWTLEEKGEPQTNLETLYTRSLTLSSVCRSTASSDFIVMNPGGTCPDGYIDPDLRVVTSEVAWYEHEKRLNQSAQLLVFVQK